MRGDAADSADGPSTSGSLHLLDPAAGRVLVFARLPVVGRVKTRLGRTLGAEKACEFYKACAAHILHECVK